MCFFNIIADRLSYNEEKGMISTMYKEIFPSRLKKARIDAGYTQVQIAAETGIPQDRISQYENGKLEPDLEKLAMLSQFLNADLNWLLGISLKK